MFGARLATSSQGGSLIQETLGCRFSLAKKEDATERKVRKFGVPPFLDTFFLSSRTVQITDSREKCGALTEVYWGKICLYLSKVNISTVPSKKLTEGHTAGEAHSRGTVR